MKRRFQRQSVAKFSQEIIFRAIFVPFLKVFKIPVQLIQMKITVVGSGYVGLCTSVGFASLDHDVICVDVDKSKVDSINRGEPPIYEEGLEELKTKEGKALHVEVSDEEEVVSMEEDKKVSAKDETARRAAKASAAAKAADDSSDE